MIMISWICYQRHRQATKVKIYKSNYIKPKNISAAKNTFNRVKRQRRKWKKIFANLIRDIYPECISNTYKSTTKKVK